MTDLLILGCGYLGRRVAEWFRRDSSGVVTGTTRSARKADELISLGIASVVADVLDPSTFAALPLPPTILYCVGFDRSRGNSMRSVYVDGLRSFLEHLEASQWSGRFVYVSSTGVYGQDTGEWVDENSPTEPKNESGQVCLDAEELLRHFSGIHSWNSATVRLSGLYGSGRLVQKAALESGKPLVGDPQRWLNLIHIDDAARVCLELLRQPSPHDLYLASDERPLHRGEYYAAMAGFLGLEPPRFVPADPADGAKGREATSKRVRNVRLKQDLNFSFLYPDIRLGIPASLSARDEATES